MLGFIAKRIQGPEILRVLVVDDDPVQRKLAALMLQKLGAEVDIAENGEQAVLACARELYSFVIMDCQMPIMDGFCATTSIRGREASTGEHVWIVGCSAHASRQMCLASGMDDFIDKPCRLHRLSELTARACDAKPLEVERNVS